LGRRHPEHVRYSWRSWWFPPRRLSWTSCREITLGSDGVLEGLVDCLGRAFVTNHEVDKTTIRMI
jgi:hypothetical protein